MNYLNITKYIYLVLALFMFYNAFIERNQPTDNFWLYIMLGCTGVFMFFFRSKFAKKFNNKSDQ